MSDRPTVAVVGGGVAGCGVARALASDHDVVILERGQVAGEATALSAGLITMTPSYHDVPAIPAHVTDFFAGYDGTGAFEYTARESVGLVPPDEDGAARRRAERLAGEGFDVAYAEPAAIERRHPKLDTDGFAGGVVYGDTGWVDPYTFATTLADDAADRGAEVRTETAVSGVVVEDGAVAGVGTDDGTVRADAVVAAAGWRTADLLADVLAVPLRPYRTQCIVVDTGADDSDLPIGWVPGEHAYFRPEHNGDVLVGGWSFAEDDPVGASRNEDEAFREHVAGLLPELLRDVDDARFVNGWAGIDGATPDTRPIVDAPAEGPDGLVLATGFHGRGVMTTPVAATAVRSLLTDETAPFPLDPFALARFDERSRDFEFHSISA